MGIQFESTAEAKQRRLDDTTINYFKRVDQVLEEDAFEDDEGKYCFIKNVFAQVEKEEIQLSRHIVTSRVLERIIPLLDSQQFNILLTLYHVQLDELARDRFASHVVETIVSHVAKHLKDDDVIKAFCRWCKTFRGNSMELLRDVYGHHVLTSCLQAASGIRVSESITKSRAQMQNMNAHMGNKKKKKKKKNFDNNKDEKEDDINTVNVTEDIPDKISKQFRKLSTAIQDDDNFGELLCHRSASSVVQCLLVIHKNSSGKRYKSLSRHICAKSRIFVSTRNEEEEDVEEKEEVSHAKLPVVLKDEIGSHMVETLIRTADDELLQAFGNKCVRPYIISLSLHHAGNYLVQTFLKVLKTEQQAIVFTSKLLQYVEDILAAGHMGVIVRLSETVARLTLKEQQKQIVDTLTESLHIPKDKASERTFVKLLLCMMTYDVFYSEEKSQSKTEDDKMKDDTNKTEETIEEKPETPKDVNAVTPPSQLTINSVNYHGVCLLKSFFGFANNHKIIDSFLSLSSEELTVVCCYSTGSFCVEAFFKSDNVPLKRKKKFVKIMSDNLHRLACDKFGSHVLDTMWARADDSTKEMITCKIRDHKHKLEGDVFGRIMLYNCGVKHRLGAVSTTTSMQDRKRKMMEDIVGTAPPNKAAKSTNKKVETPATKEQSAIKQEVSKAQEPAAKPKKVKKDRAERYREELARLGIAGFETPSITAPSAEIKLETDDTKVPDAAVLPPDNSLAFILNAIDATTKNKHNM